MVTSAQYDEVFETVVEVIAIDVVDVLPGLERPAKVLGHDVAVDVPPLAIDGHRFVFELWSPEGLEAIRGEELREVHPGETRARAVFGRTQAILRYIEQVAAALTDQQASVSDRADSHG